MMTALALDDDRLTSALHRLLEHLTVLKLQVDMLHLGVDQVHLELADVGAYLDQINEEIDATVAVAKRLLAEQRGTT
jgi:hypothetical protein